ncbi:hypothetical protein GCM10022415_01370 [Knoellia locipacati]|uniref:Aminoglycoside phosphotransferase domain-containing protein n=1 Tax=Knoellia locipacati TaxID=882824 RepID=A0A512SVX0_9MICO|nr:phosphotransferase [Knoellia locipacati]GEQ12090.1 hypothetical protein KLO01_01370 [Knoellia locipacati]
MDDFAEWVRVTFGLGEGPLTCSVGGHGADGEVWHLQVGSRHHAVKRPFRVVDVEALQREADLLGHLGARGVEVPTHVTARDGRLVVEVPDRLGGGWTRVSHWVEGTSVGGRPSEVAEPLGRLLAQLHQAAPRASEAPRAWHTRMPPPERWRDLVERSVGQPWQAALEDALDTLGEYAEIVEAAGSGAQPFLVGHCDLHPDNVLLAADGGLRAIDWEDAGAMDPTRELAKTLVQWHVLGEEVDEGAVAATVRAYVEAGGPGLLSGLTDFAMVMCSESNFLAHQLAVALDEGAPPQRRLAARDEITEALAGYLPGPGAIERVLRAARTSGRAAP